MTPEEIQLREREIRIEEEKLQLEKARDSKEKVQNREVLGILVSLANVKGNWTDYSGILKKIIAYKNSDSTLNEWRIKAIKKCKNTAKFLE